MDTTLCPDHLGPLLITSIYVGDLEWLTECHGWVELKVGCIRQDGSHCAAVTNNPLNLSDPTKQMLISCSYKVHGEIGWPSRAPVLCTANQPSRMLRSQDTSITQRLPHRGKKEWRFGPWLFVSPAWKWHTSICLCEHAQLQLIFPWSLEEKWIGNTGEV